MTENTPFDQQPAKLSTGLNVLTILTFIGCAIGLLAGAWQFFGAKKGLDAMEEVINSGKVDEMPSFLKGMYSAEALEQARIAYENRLPLLIINLVGIALCLYGAIQMRSLKKQGYLLYVIGELLPFIGVVIFIGAATLTQMSGIVGIAIAVLFILLYTNQRKHLIN